MLPVSEMKHWRVVTGEVSIHIYFIFCNKTIFYSVNFYQPTILGLCAPPNVGLPSHLVCCSESVMVTLALMVSILADVGVVTIIGHVSVQSEPTKVVQVRRGAYQLTVLCNENEMGNCCLWQQQW